MQQENEVVKTNPKIFILYISIKFFFFILKIPKTIVMFSFHFSFRFLLFNLTSFIIIYFKYSSIKLV